MLHNMMVLRMACTTYKNISRNEITAIKHGVTSTCQPTYTHTYMYWSREIIFHVFPFIYRFTNVHCSTHKMLNSSTLMDIDHLYCVNDNHVTASVCVCAVCTQSTIWSFDIIKHLEKQSTRNIASSTFRVYVAVVFQIQVRKLYLHQTSRMWCKAFLSSSHITCVYLCTYTYTSHSPWVNFRIILLLRTQLTITYM